LALLVTVCAVLGTLAGVGLAHASYLIADVETATAVVVDPQRVME
jgi:hypothetical protein